MRTENPGSRPSRLPWAVRNLDLLVVIGGVPIALLLGVPIGGYALGAGCWVLLRGLGLAVERQAAGVTHVVEQIALRLSYRLVRAALLAGAAIVALKTGGKGDGLAALAVMVAAFTIRLPLSVVEAHGAGRAPVSS